MLSFAMSLCRTISNVRHDRSPSCQIAFLSLTILDMVRAFQRVVCPFCLFVAIKVIELRIALLEVT